MSIARVALKALIFGKLENAIRANIKDRRLCSPEKGISDIFDKRIKIFCNMKFLRNSLYIAVALTIILGIGAVVMGNWYACAVAVTMGFGVSTLLITKIYYLMLTSLKLY